MANIVSNAEMVERMSKYENLRCTLVYETDNHVLVRFLVLLDFLRSSGSGTRSTQPLEYN
jgi:hypothetical protein